jgi:hypothetical protein
METDLVFVCAWVGRVLVWLTELQYYRLHVMTCRWMQNLPRVGGREPLVLPRFRSSSDISEVCPSAIVRIFAVRSADCGSVRPMLTTSSSCMAEAMTGVKRLLTRLEAFPYCTRARRVLMGGLVECGWVRSSTLASVAPTENLGLA